MNVLFADPARELPALYLQLPGATAARGGKAQHRKRHCSEVGKFPILLLSALTLSHAGVELDGVCSYHPMLPQGHDELQSNAKLGNSSPHDDSFTSILTDHLAAKGI